MNMDEHPAIRTDCRKSFVFDNDYLDRRDPRDDPRSVPRYFRAASFPACLTHATTRLIVGNLALGLQRKPENDDSPHEAVARPLSVNWRLDI